MRDLRVGQKRQVLEIYHISGKPDQWGQPAKPEKMMTIRGHVINRRADEIQRFGTELTTDLITVVIDYVPNIEIDMYIRWVTRRSGERTYQIKSINFQNDYQTELWIAAEYVDHERNYKSDDKQ